MDLETVNNKFVEKMASLSLGQNVSSFYEISEATRFHLDQGEPHACKQAAKTISRGKSASDPCWPMVARLYQKALESGDLESCFELAWLHFAGVAGVQQSDEKAIEYWQHVINSECNSEDSSIGILKNISTYMVGLFHFLGIGTELDLVTGWKLINDSKSDGFVLAGQWAFDWIWDHSIDHIQSASPASIVFFEHVTFKSDNQSLLKHLEGVCYFYGLGTSRDQHRAVGIFSTLANSGFAASQVVLGSCYIDGYVVEKSNETAVDWFTRSTEHGYAYGQLALGGCYLFGYGVLKDYSKSVEWYQKAADQGLAAAQCALGVHYLQGWGVAQDYFKTVEWYQKAADQGYADAQGALGIYYSQGWGVAGVAQDYFKAVEWCQKAADQGLPVAQNFLGLFYENGWGVAQDYGIAIGWYQKAADQGCAMAQNNLGICYYRGHGVAQDKAKAVELYQKAADQGLAAAQCNLGTSYHYGTGVSQDYDKAVEWYQKAADQGLPAAQKNLGFWRFFFRLQPWDHQR